MKVLKILIIRNECNIRSNRPHWREVVNPIDAAILLVNDSGFNIHLLMQYPDNFQLAFFQVYFVKYEMGFYPRTEISLSYVTVIISGFRVYSQVFYLVHKQAKISVGLFN